MKDRRESIGTTMSTWNTLFCPRNVTLCGMLDSRTFSNEKRCLWRIWNQSIRRTNRSKDTLDAYLKGGDALMELIRKRREKADMAEEAKDRPEVDSRNSHQSDGTV